MSGPGHDVPQGVAVARFVAGTVALAVLSGLATLVLWAVAYPLVRGWSATAVTSGSMEPAISVGDVLVTGPAVEDRLEPGAIIVFDVGGGTGLVTHRLVEQLPSGEFLTRGDANELTDSTPVRVDQIEGTGRLVVPVVGRPQAWAANGDVMALALTAIGLLVLIGASRWGLLAEFDPWAEPRLERPQPQRGRLAPALAAGVALLIFGTAVIEAQPASATFADPSQTDASSITAAASFP